MATITDEQIHEVFTSFDVDGSETLNMSELSNALNLLGIDLTEEELTDTYQIDDNPDTLNEEEFRAYVRDRIGDVDFRQRTLECFLEFMDEADSETRSISREKMKEILTQRGTNQLDEETAEELLDDFDVNGDGQFNVDELVQLMYHMESEPPEAEEHQDSRFRLS